MEIKERWKFSAAANEPKDWIFFFFFWEDKNTGNIVDFARSSICSRFDVLPLFRNSSVVRSDVAWISLSSETTDAGVKRLSSLYLLVMATSAGDYRAKNGLLDRDRRSILFLKLILIIDTSRLMKIVNCKTIKARYFRIIVIVIRWS